MIPGPDVLYLYYNWKSSAPHKWAKLSPSLQKKAMAEGKKRITKLGPISDAIKTSNNLFSFPAE